MQADTLPDPRSSPQHQAVFDGLRGLACLLVMFGHTGTWLHDNSAGGQPGVMLFFILSGYLMAMHYGVVAGLRNWAGFFIRRIFRIYPLYILVLLLYALLHYKGMDVTLLREHLLLQKGISTFWTIPVEMKFYLAFPLIALLVRRGPGLALFALSLFLANDGGRGMIALWPYLCCFLGGMVLWRVQLPPTKAGQGDAVAIGCFAMIYALIQWFGIPSDDVFFIWQHAYLIVPCMVLAVAGVIAANGIVRRFLSSAPMRFIGTVSYGAYLIHFILFEYIRAWELPMVVHVAASYSTVLIGAALLHALVEAPMIAMGKRLSLRVMRG